ncbi:axial regulator YABBY 4-like isoform X1 [Actinidia eriantha]|uniref:axial regulator YABBY 4-like isoform X1 n=1 Tax=Actinidia eriantha TaxID=165200 RepID=UPI00258B7737|nr:axial regulator YABBY 4-like isoform X1 [Actinidia eriantha]
MWLLHHHFTGGVAILMFFAFICLLSSFLLYYFTFQIQVSVPYSSLLMGVTVRCGHCTSLLSVNVMKVSFIPLHLLTSLNQDEPKQEVSPELEADAEKGLDKRSPSLVISSDDEEDDEVPVNHIVNRPPEKRQRAPSAYNNFIKEEIRRLKAKYPNTTHKEAFSAAAKNVSFQPNITDICIKSKIRKLSEALTYMSNFSGQISHQFSTKEMERAVARDLRERCQGAQVLERYM